MGKMPLRVFFVGMLLCLTALLGCSEEEASECDAPNACGGCEALSSEPGEACGPCGDGVQACVSANEVGCTGQSEASACGNNEPNNASNNGVCGDACGEGEVCEEGQCVCDPGQHDGDDLNCGCEGPCGEGLACVEGVCVDPSPLEECEEGVCVATSVVVPSGPFTMGPYGDAPQREVTLTRSYLMQRTEVTQGQYEDLMGNNPSYFGPDGDDADCGSNCPVEQVNWFDAVAYCNALSVHEGFEPCYDGEGAVIGGETVYDCEGWRLPTEAEWEKAARGTDGQTYPWGEEEPTCERVVMFDDSNGGFGCGRASTWPVASKPSGLSPYGLHDMGGNVWEWTWDWFEDGAGPEMDPVGPVSGSDRIMRGGSWAYDASGFPAATRQSSAPSFADFNIGFRCVRSN